SLRLEGVGRSTGARRRPVLHSRAALIETTDQKEVTMGLFDDIKNQVGSALAGSESPLAAALLQLLANPSAGGLQGLVESFRQQGLEHVIQSWMSAGQTIAVSPQQITQVLGSERVQQLAAAAGIDVQTASAKLAEILPQIVGQATPDGKLPVGELLEKGLGFLQGLKTS